MPQTESPTPFQAMLAWITAIAGAIVLGEVVRPGLGAIQDAGYLSGPIARLIVLAITMQAALVGAVLIWTSALDLRVRAVGGFRRAEPLAYGAGLLLLVGLFPIAGVFAQAVQELLGYPGVLQVIQDATRGASSAEFYVALVMLSVLPGFAEEFLFRGFIMSAFIGRSPALGIVVTSVLFATIHLDPAQITGTLVIGGGLGALRVASGSVLPCMAAHAGYNALVLLSVRYEIPDAVLMVILALSLVTGVWGLAWLWKRRSATA